MIKVLKPRLSSREKTKCIISYFQIDQIVLQILNLTYLLFLKQFPAQALSSWLYVIGCIDSTPKIWPIQQWKWFQTQVKIYWFHLIGLIESTPKIWQITFLEMVSGSSKVIDCIWLATLYPRQWSDQTRWQWLVSVQS